MGSRILLHETKRADTLRNTVIVLGILLALSPCAFPLDPSLDVNQYAHTVWKVSEGLSKGAIWSIAQTPDGYLWLGTEFGLLRFDGVRAVPWHSSAGEQLPSSDIRSLRAAGDGRLWIGTYRGLVSWKDGKLTRYTKLDGLIVESLLEDREGTLWVVAGWTLSEARLCRIQGGKTQCYGEDGGAGSRVTCVYEDSGGNLWAGGMKGVWRWKPGPPKLYPMAAPEQRTYALTESDDGGILIARHDGITKLKNGEFKPYPLPARLQFEPGRLFRDRNGALWIGALTDQGLLHIHQAKIDVFTPAGGVSGDLSGNTVLCFFEDREGNIWVSTPDGLDRFREFAVPTFSVQQGLSSRAVSAVLAARDGSLWVATSHGLNRWNKGEVTIYRKHRMPTGGLAAGQLAEPWTTIREFPANRLPDDALQSLFEDDKRNIWVSTVEGIALLQHEGFVPLASVPPGNVLSLTGDSAGNVWVSHNNGLFHFFKTRLVENIPWAKLSHREPASALLPDAAEGGLWLGFRDGGVAFFKDGQIRASLSSAQGLAEGFVRSFYKDGKGALWTATAGGLSRIKDGHVLTLTSQNGLPCNSVHWMMEDDIQSVWLYTACGLVRIARPELDAWVSQRINTIQVTVLDASDGVKSHETISGYSPLVAKATDGTIWFSSSEGVSVIVPGHLPFNNVPPPVHIEQITADDKQYDTQSGMRLQAGLRNLAIDYTALSLVVPEKVHFRYKLEGQNQDWHEVVNDRQVQYTNLRPGKYRFRLKACNNSGVWNEEGALLEFEIPPMWYQTNWFYALCAAAFLVSLWAAYQLRVRQLAAQFNIRLEERVAERTRIARDLHDTMLQGVQGLLLHLQAVLVLIPKRPEKACETLENALVSAEKAIAEGRSSIQDLRLGVPHESGLEQMLLALGRELASSQKSGESAPSLQVIIEGNRRAKRPVIEDEVHRIARELVRNAYRHAHAQNVEAELRYDDDAFLLVVRDDGKGIDAKVLKDRGRAGHWGLPGMYERAKGIGARLDIWSEPGVGTEVRLTVPGAIAYEKSGDEGRFKLFRRMKSYERR